jgi:hypothetical protein
MYVFIASNRGTLSPARRAAPEKLPAGSGKKRGAEAGGMKFGAEA